MAPPRIYKDTKAPLTADEARQVLDYDPETGVLRWKIHTGMAKVGQIAGTDNGRGYLIARVKDKLYVAHRLAWLITHGEWPHPFLDHINGIRSDNRIANLRVATKSQNCANCCKHKRNSSGYKGVMRYRSRWQSRIMVNRQVYHLGVFDTPEEAHAAYVTAAQKHFGEFARAS